MTTYLNYFELTSRNGTCNHCLKVRTHWYYDFGECPPVPICPPCREELGLVCEPVDNSGQQSPKGTPEVAHEEAGVVDDVSAVPVPVVDVLQDGQQAASDGVLPG